ncbi:MAG: hypothetical protein AAF214_01090 [Pseudomonadota bacterium]
MQADVTDLTMSRKSRIEFYNREPTSGRKMIGVILWSDAADNTAVIWCEDQGDLAFLSSADTVHLPDQFFDVGDVVKFDVTADRNMRLAKNAMRVDQNCGTGLRDGLQAISLQTSDMPTSNTAEIIPFRIEHATRALPASIPQQQRRG